MFFIYKYFLYFLCLFVPDKELKGRLRNKAKNCKSYYKVRRMAKSVGKNLKITGNVRINRETVIGNNVGFNDGLCIDGAGKVIFGNNIATGRDLLIIAQSHDYDHGDKLPFGNKDIFKDIIIEDNVWIGSRVTLVPGAVIREGAIIQAGSTVVNEIPKCAIAGGHPAKVFKYRDFEHYEKLKKEGKFINSDLQK